MTDKSEQPKEQSNTDDSLKSIEDLKSMSLEDMEKELKSKDYSQVNDQADEDSEASDESSEDDQSQNPDDQKDDEDQSEEQDSNEDSEDNDSQSSETDEEDDASDNQKDKSKSKKKKPFDVEKAYKELQGEFTRRNQKLAALEAELETMKASSTKSPDKDEKSEKSENSKLAQLRKKDPEAAAALEALIQEQVDKQVKERIKPVEERVTLRSRKENAETFANKLTEFQSSELAELEPQLLSIYNENPAKWQQLVLDNGDEAFNSLKKELLYRHFDRAAELKAKKSKEAKSASDKQDRLKGSQVGTKTKVTQPTRDVMSDDDFKALPLAEMEKRLKKVRN